MHSSDGEYWASPPETGQPHNVRLLKVEWNFGSHFDQDKKDLKSAEQKNDII